MHHIHLRVGWRAWLSGAAIAAACACVLVASTAASGQTKKVSTTNFVSYTKGKAGKANASLPPLKIGWVDNIGGQLSVAPTATKGAEFAVKYINENTGGVGGHPVQLFKCPIPNTEEQGTTCGQKLLNAKDVPVILFGGVAVGASSLEAVLKGRKPIVCAVCINAGDATNPNTYILGGTSSTISWQWGAAARKFGPKATSAAVVYPQGPGFEPPAQAEVKGLKASGFKTVKVVGLDPKSADVSGALQAAGVGSVDYVLPVPDPPMCITIAKALTQLNVSPDKVISSPLCLTATVAQALGDFPKWYYGTAQDVLDPGRPATAAYKKVLDKYKLGKNLNDPWFAAIFAEVLTTVQWANAIGYDKVSATTIAKQAKAFRGPLLLGQPHINCGKYKSFPASCADETIFFKYQGKGKYKLAADWLLPPPSLRPKG